MSVPIDVLAMSAMNDPTLDWRVSTLAFPLPTLTLPYVIFRSEVVVMAPMLTHSPMYE